MIDSAPVSVTETIAAISTPPGVGAIAIIRMSGPKACAITEKLFRTPFSNADGKWLSSHHASYGKLHNIQGDAIDEVVVIPYLKPHSYTGEDLIEINCHGSPVVAKRILSILIDQGARLARRGEFTERAFVNGRIDLTQAEAVLDLIQSKTGRQSRSALSVLSGDLGRQIGSIRMKLLDLLTNITAGIDFPEEIGETPHQDVDSILTEAIEQLGRLAATAVSGKYLREGLRVAIVGRPNAGKSSLLNQLLKSDRAIVSDLPGTTRDLIEEVLDMNGLPVVLVDTAGIRHTQDTIERMGMERSELAIKDAEMILHVVDATLGWQEQEENIGRIIGAKPWFLLYNKIDLVQKPAELEDKSPQYESKLADIRISAKTGEGLTLLAERICAFALGENSSGSEGPTLNERQASLCGLAVKDLELARQTVEAAMPQDCLATDLKMAIDRLSEISGQMVSEEVIASVFANFCIGK